MFQTNKVNSFNINPLVIEIENVIQEGLHKILSDYTDRYNLLEKTHREIMNLPSIREEFNRNNYESDNDTQSDFVGNITTNIKNVDNYSVKNAVCSLETRLDKLERNYDTIIPVLDKILNKINKLGNDICELQSDRNNSSVETFHTVNIEKSTAVKTSENENIEIHVEEPIKELVEEEFEDSDEEDINPLLITCSTIILNNSEKETEEKPEEDDDELSVGEELGEHVEPEIEIVEEETVEEETAEDVEETVEEESVEEEEESVEEEDVEETAEEEEEEESEDVEEESEDVEEESEDVEEESEDVEEESEDIEASVTTIQCNKLSDEASIETETKEQEEEQEEDEELFEIEIDDKTYCTNNDQNGFIWELTEEGESGEKIGYLKDGDAFFYEDEN
jgi:hypothetical protein